MATNLIMEGGLATMKVGVSKEVAPGERRVALVPETVPRLREAGLEVLVEAGAGDGAWFTDAAYADAGAEVVDASTLYQQADVLLCVQPPDEDRVKSMRADQVLIGMLAPTQNTWLVDRGVEQKVTTVSLDLLPRTLSRAQTMDALSSQANFAGYKAVLLAATTFGRYFPMMMTAAGTAKPARLLILGVGVAGLAAIGTARRLGAIVSAYDIRPETREEVASLGANFLDLGGVSGSGEGGYARALTPEEQAAQQQAIDEKIAGFDIVITTAQVPGRRPPRLVTARAVEGMKPGSVLIDLAAGPLGGNVELSKADETVVTPGGVTIVGAGNLPATMSAGASAAYARNISALLAHLVKDGALALDLNDEITGPIVVTHGGAVTNAAIAGASVVGGNA